MGDTGEYFGCKRALTVEHQRLDGALARGRASGADDGESAPPQTLGEVVRAVAQAEAKQAMRHASPLPGASSWRKCAAMIARLVPLALALSLAVPAWAQSPSADPAKRYSACMALARAEPVKAVGTAQAWYKDGGGLAARHCAAIAF